MDYSSELVSVEIKFDFIDNLGEFNWSGEWVECRLTMRPLEEFVGWLQVMCYPKGCDNASPFFIFEHDIQDIKLGPVGSRTKTNVYGLFWRKGAKRCKLFFAFENKSVYDTYIAYLKDVLQKCKNQQDVIYANVNSIALNSSWNDGLLALLNNTQDIPSKHGIASSNALIKSVCVSNVSGIYHEVQLRPSEQKDQRSMRRPIAILGDLFATKRSKTISSKSMPDEIPELPPRNSQSAADDKKIIKPKKSLRKIKSFWNIMRKSKKTFISAKSVSEPSLPKKSSEQSPASSLTDLTQYFESNVKFESFDDMHNLNNIENIDDLTNIFNSTNTIERKHSNISLNLPWSHNLSTSYDHVLFGDISDINLLGANVNKEQIHSEIFIEQDYRPISFGISAPPNFHKFTVSEVDENGYAIMRPIIREENRETNDSLNTTYISFNADLGKTENFQCDHGIYQTPTRRNTSFDNRSSSGYSSDSNNDQDQTAQLQPKQMQLNKSIFDDETISLDEKSATSESAESINTHRNCNLWGEVNDCEIFENANDSMLHSASKCCSTPFKMNLNNDLNKFLSSAIAALEQFDGPAINRQSSIISQPLTGMNVKNIYEDVCSIEKISQICSIQPIDSTNKLPTRQFHENDSTEKSQSFSKRIWKTCSDIRQLTTSLMSVRKAMLNFV